MILVVLLILAFSVLVIGSYTDLRTREVPDWLNYAGIFTGLGLRTLYSAATLDHTYIISGLLGFGLFFAIALAMFYLGQWGGGDSKTIMAMGALLGFELDIDNMAVAFIINSIFIGAAYGLLWAGYFAIKSRHKFTKTFKRLIGQRGYRSMHYGTVGLSLALALTALAVPLLTYKISLLTLALFTSMMFYLFIFTKSVELACMYKRVDPSKLTEGDWIATEINYKGQHIAGPEDLGVERYQITRLKQLRNRHALKTVLVKEGMPFIPNFLITFIITFFLGNIITYAI